MILIFDKIKEMPDQISKSGTRYDCWRLYGKKKGFNNGPDMPYEKTVFESDTITVIEQGITRPGCSLLQFLQKACKSGDSLTIKSEQEGRYWRWCSIEKYLGQRNREVPTYEPLDTPSSASEDYRQEWMD